MSREKGVSCRGFTLAAGSAVCLLAASVCAQTIVDEWSSVQAPPPPVLKTPTIDRKTTALLMVDFNKQSCNPQRRPRCVASLPKIKSLLAAARSAGVPVVYTVGGGGTRADIVPEVAPTADESSVSSGLDKFVNTDLEKILREKGVATVIVVGAAAHGAVLYTASGAAMRGMKVILPLDGISAELAYAEQYTAWHLANVPVISGAMTLTTIDGVRF